MIYESIRLDKNSVVPMYRRLYESIRGGICSGNIPVGERLPSIRKISEELGVSRTTVEQAYQQLCVEGYVSSRPQSGYFVEASVRSEFAAEPEKPSAREQTPGIRYDFGSRYVDSRSADIELWRKYVRSVLSREDIVNSYGHYQGEPELRRQLVTYSMTLRGVNSTAERIVIGAGVQPLLSVLCGLLGEQAGRVGIEYPCFPQAERVFRDFRLNIVELPHDKFGVTAEDLYSHKIDVLYLNPSNTESMGRPMPISRRAEIMEWAERTNGLIIEDDYNGALRFKSRPVPSLQGMSGGDRVVYLGSFSKLLMPSVRISYMVLPGDLAELYRERGVNYNQTSSKVEQLALAQYMRDGHIEKRLRRLRKIYAEKSDLLMTALKEALGGAARIRLAETALCVDVIIECGINSQRLAEKALANGVKIIPVDCESGAEFRLSFAGIPSDDICGGVETLGKIINHNLAEN